MTKGARSVRLRDVAGFFRDLGADVSCLTETGRSHRKVNIYGNGGKVVGEVVISKKHGTSEVLVPFLYKILDGIIHHRLGYEPGTPEFATARADYRHRLYRELR